MGLRTGAICEDYKPSLTYIQQQLSEQFVINQFDIRLDCFSDPKQLLAEIIEKHVHYDVLFMDIEMPGMNGLDVCRQIRIISKETLIVFISNREDFVYQTFEVQPFRFIRKNHFKEELPAMAHALIQEFKNNEELCITLKELHSDSIYTVDVHQIVYIEVIARYCHIITLNKQELKIQYKLKDLALILQNYGFLQPHRSYLVNYRSIFRIEKDQITLDSGERIPLSRGYRDSFTNNFFTLMNGVD